MILKRLIASVGFYRRRINGMFFIFPFSFIIDLSTQGLDIADINMVVQ
jgi:hypothetical protein